MIYGIGCDLCAVARIERGLTGAHRARFARRVFSAAEWQQLAGLGPRRRWQSAAANFAAKEAFLKAAGVGLGHFALAEIGVARCASGAPAYALEGAAAQWLAEKGLCAHLSLSHDGGVALAFCVLEHIA